MAAFIKLFAVLLIFQTLVIAQEEKSQTSETDNAVSAANEWLSLVDSSNFAKSWEEASELFKNAVTKEKWEETLSDLLPPFGKVVIRKVKSSKYATSLPGAPDGEYVVIVYKTEFENKKEAYETVTPMVDEDGKWRVSGYFIK